MIDLRAFVPTWSLLRRLAGSKVVTLTALMPFIGYMIVLNADADEFVSLIIDDFGTPQIDISLNRLYQIYIGLTLTGGGVIVWRVLCPPEVKLYERKEDFATGEFKISTPNLINDRLAMLNGLASPLIPKAVKEEAGRSLQGQFVQSVGEVVPFPQPLDKEKLTLDSWQRNNEDSILDVLLATYTARNFDKPLSRAVCSILLSVGYGVLVWPGIRVFVEVMDLLLQDPLSRFSL